MGEEEESDCDVRQRSWGVGGWDSSGSYSELQEGCGPEASFSIEQSSCYTSAE